MCGILAVLCCSDDSQAKRVRVLELSRRYIKPSYYYFFFWVLNEMRFHDDDNLKFCIILEVLWLDVKNALIYYIYMYINAKRVFMTKLVYKYISILVLPIEIITYQKMFLGLILL